MNTRFGFAPPSPLFNVQSSKFKVQSFPPPSAPRRSPAARHHGGPVHPSPAAGRRPTYPPSSILYPRLQLRRLALAACAILACILGALGQTVWQSPTVIYNLTLGSGAGGGGLPKDTQNNTTTGSNTVANATLETYHASYFVAGSSYTATSINLRLGKVGSPTMNLTAYIYSDNAGVPGTMLTGGASGVVAASTINSSEGDTSFTGLTCSITSGTKYWIVLFGSAVDASNYVAWYMANAASDPLGRTKKSTNASTWTGVSNNKQDKFTVFGW
jgi:hypothetical protein